MKKSKTSDFFGSKGFYVALFSAVLLVVAIAAVVSNNNRNTSRQAENELSKANQSYALDTTTTGNNSNSSVTTPNIADPFNSSGNGVDKDTRLAGTTNPTTGINSNTTASAGTTGTSSPSSPQYSNNSSSYATNSPDPIVSSKPVIEVTEEEVVETSVSTSKPITETVIEPVGNSVTEAAEEQPELKEKVTQAENEEPVTTAEVSVETEETPESSETFLNFSESSKMIWPVIGDVAMNFSMDHVIYDKTLDQYRTNSGVSIVAPAGSQVKSAAAGKIVSVEYDDQSGNTVVIDHGNGWKTTYGQLQNNVLVDVGQTVKEGQVIGGVDTPTRYGILLGDHLEFKVTKNDVPQDPSSVLGGVE